MNLHFYTAWDNVDVLEKGKEIQVWNKSEAKETDIHINLNTSDYIVTKTPSKTVFVAIKVTWRTN